MYFCDDLLSFELVFVEYKLVFAEFYFDLSSIHLLRHRVGEDYWSYHWAYELAILGSKHCWVVDLEKILAKLLVANYLRVELHLDYLGMAKWTLLHLLITGPLSVTLLCHKAYSRLSYGHFMSIFPENIFEGDVKEVLSIMEGPRSKCGYICTDSQGFYLWLTEILVFLSETLSLFNKERVMVDVFRKQTCHIQAS